MSPVGSLAGQARQRLGGSRRDRNLEPRRAMIAQVVYLSPAAGSPASTQTALITPVPAADPVVGQVRERFDVAASWGVPAHITVIYPFVSPDEVSEELISDLHRIISPVPAFTCRFERTRWFGDDVVWLDPDPAQPFCDLTNAVWDAFPQHPPYAGAHPQIVPHLTIAQARLADSAQMLASEHAVRRHLPLTSRIEHVLLIAGAPAPRSWHLVHRFDLAESASDCYKNNP